MSIKVLTAGESHGQALSVILDGLPAGIPITQEFIDNQLRRRQRGYGRGKRMVIEQDSANVLSGVRFGKTTGAPVSLLIINKDWDNWKEKLSPFGDRASVERISIPRPGHADLAAVQKYQLDDIRDSIERSSARETAARVASGVFLKSLLSVLGISIDSIVESIGGVYSKEKLYRQLCAAKIPDTRISEIIQTSETSSVKVADKVQEKQIIEAIKEAKKNGDTLGGTFIVIVRGVKPGIGSFSQLEKKLDGALAFALMSLNAVKGVEIGMGFAAADSPGSKVHDEILASPRLLQRRTNNAGGIEGGISTGENILIRAAMKPIATLMMPLGSVDLRTMAFADARRERSDFTAVPACSVIAESLVALPIANAILEKFGGDSIQEIVPRYNDYYADLADRLQRGFNE